MPPGLSPLPARRLVSDYYEGDNMTRAVIRNAGEGCTTAVVGDVYRFLATGDDTNGKYALWEAIVPPRGGPPPHVHGREEEPSCRSARRTRSRMNPTNRRRC